MQAQARVATPSANCCRRGRFHAVQAGLDACFNDKLAWDANAQQARLDVAQHLARGISVLKFLLQALRCDVNPMGNRPTSPGSCHRLQLFRGINERVRQREMAGRQNESEAEPGRSSLRCLHHIAKSGDAGQALTAAEDKAGSEPQCMRSRYARESNCGLSRKESPDSATAPGNLGHCQSSPTTHIGEVCRCPQRSKPDIWFRVPPSLGLCRAAARHLASTL